LTKLVNPLIIKNQPNHQKSRPLRLNRQTQRF